MRRKVEIGVVHFGCRANYSDTERIEEALGSNPYVNVVPHSLRAPVRRFDAVIINSCTVTESADRDCQILIRKLANQHPKPLLGIVGCLASRAPKEVLALPGVDNVFSTKRKQDVVGWVLGALGVPQNDVESAPTTILRRRHRAFVKIQDGCQDYCAFCVVPFARGGSRSLDLDTVVKRCATLVAQGVKEIVITGINVGRYGLDLFPKRSLVDVFEHVGQIPELQRVRLSSIDPMDITVELLDCLKRQKALLPSFHLPVQSGSDVVLKAMRRRFLVRDIHTRVSWIRERFPDAFISCDVLVGFPGETETDFQMTVGLVSHPAFCRFHVFPYSRRPGTRAYSIRGQVSESVKTSRVQDLKTLSQIRFREAARQQLGKQTYVLVETIKNNVWYGYSQNYFPVHGLCEDAVAPNAIIHVELTSVTEKPWLTFSHTLRGTQIHSPQ